MRLFIVAFALLLVFQNATSQVDNDGKTSTLILPVNNKLTSELRTDMLNGIVVIKGEAAVPTINSGSTSISTKTKPFIAIPYYSWTHRGEGEMTVCFPEKITAIDLDSH